MKKKWGGKRPGAGRKNRTKTVNHMKREPVDLCFPMHINQKLVPNLPSLRTKKFHKQLSHAFRAARKFGLHVLHYSILTNHIHLICEAKNNRRLGSGMRSLFGRISRIIRRNLDQPWKGSVFKGRYFSRAIRSAPEMRRALNYVLFNMARHLKLIEHIDPFSSAAAFRHWKPLLKNRWNGMLEDQLENLKTVSLDRLGLSPPQSWLADSAWMSAHW